MSTESLLLNEERKKSEKIFDTRKLTLRVWGGEENLVLRERAIQEISRDNILNDYMKRYDMSREKLRENSLKKLYRAMEITDHCEQKNEFKYRDIFWSVLNGTDRALGMRYFIISKLWIETIQSQGTPEQQKKWIPPAKKMELIGCFGMTELGHSSFLRGAETTAIFDEKTDEFIINSPTLTSTKVWQGFAGCTATHGLILANLFLDKKSCGIQTFLVPLRDMKTGNPFPGIALGDMGPKIGLNGIDNGWMQFSHVRIPRNNMLMRWAKVERNGEFFPPPNPAIAYASTVTERVTSLIGAAISTDPALTIAIRYSLLRRQGPNDEQIIDYQSQQLRLIPHLSTSFAFRFAGYRLSQYWAETLENLSKGNAHILLKNLPDIHSTSCGMKAFSTWWGTEAQEMCRRALGGHAFHSFSGIPQIINDFHVLTTGGGDNIVIAQQTANFLLKSFKKAMNNKELNGSVVYFEKAKEILEKKNQLAFDNNTDFLNHKTQESILLIATIRKLAQVVDSMNSQSSKVSKTEIFNDHLCELVEVVRLHCYLFAFQSFVHFISETEDEQIRSILSQNCHLFILYFIQKNPALFLETKVLSSTILIRKKVYELSKELRNHSASLVDSLHVPDIILKSSLGAFDGNIYERYLGDMKNFGESANSKTVWNELVKPKLNSKL